jgi:tetratricopeptide (TPR) repeat protein
MFRRFRRWWDDKATLFFAQGLVAALRGFFRIQELFAPPERKAKLRRFREGMEKIEREKNELLRDIDTIHTKDRDHADAVMDKLHEFGRKHGGDRDDSEWQTQRSRIKALRSESRELVAIHEASGEDHAKAVAAFQSYIDVNPQNYRAYSWLAGRLTKTGDYDGAIAAYEAAIRICPDDATRYITVSTAKNAIAEVWFLKGDTNAAIQSFQEAIAAVPADGISLKSLSYLRIGNLYEKTGDLVRAKSAWREAIKHDDSGIIKAEAEKRLKEFR